MKKIIKLLLLIFTLSSITFVNSQTEGSECLIMHEGTFFYGKKKDKMVVIENDILTENLGYGQLIITSNIVWINDCEYNATILKVSKPNDKFYVGDRLHVKITEVVKNKIYYTASKNSYTWSGHFIKKKKKKKKNKGTE